MLSFTEYASEKRILEMLIKERVKVALKSKLKAISPVDIVKKAEQKKRLTIAEHIFMLMPPRDSWVRPQKRDRIQKDGNEKKSDKQVMTRSIALTIKKHRKSPENHPYLKRLDAYISMLRKDITGNTPLEFNSIKIIGKKKKVTPDSVIIMRPICTFESLREKLLIALANKYLSEAFDTLLHEEILSYRPLRKYHNCAEPIFTNRDNAFDNLQKYRNAHKHHNIYVAECDIQKYFDTINHDVIRSCFANLAKRLQSKHPEFEYRCVERILDAYLNSYSFYKNIIVKNKQMLAAWQKQQDAQKKQERKGTRIMLRVFEEPKTNLFIERGCYNENEFSTSTNKIGIPQGGALSGLISNVVLNNVDSESILNENDPNRFFCRYGDDIILMHTSRRECEKLINQYCKALTKHKLLYHEFSSVADMQYRKADGTTRQALWDQKSRSPFLWGRDGEDKEQVDWIGFLGYEMRYTGEVRIRRSSLNDKFKSIKRKYHTGAKTLIARGLFKKDIEKEILNRIDRFKSEGLISAKSLNKNKYCMTQALKLDAYASKNLYRLLYKIACKNSLTPEELATWWERAKEHGCMNYRRTYNTVSKARN